MIKEENEKKYIELTLEEINFSSENIRENSKYKDDPKLQGLAKSIIIYGLRQPVIVYKGDKDKYEIVHGKRRVHAFKQISTSSKLKSPNEDNEYIITEDDRQRCKKIPCILQEKPVDNEEFILSQFAENQHRKDLDNIEESNLMNKLLENNNFNQAKLAEKVGKSKQLINDLVGLQKIPPKIRGLVQQIQLYGCTENKYWEMEYDASYKIKNIGIKTLQTIANAEPEKQAAVFWKIFHKECTGLDAKELGLDLSKELPEKEKDLLKSISSKYFQISKKANRTKKAHTKDECLSLKKVLAISLIESLIEENGIDPDELLNQIREEAV
jgi:ParB-like chromosome segregation protein Spo0J